MTKQMRGGNRNGRRRDPNQDVQPWLGWMAAVLVVFIIVVAVAMGMERTGNQRMAEAEVRMTPLVGGMALPVTAGTASGEPEVAEVTPLPAAVTETVAITGGEILTDTEEVTGTVEMSETGALSETDSVTVTDEVSDEVAVTDVVTITDVVTVTDEITVTVDVTPEVTAETAPEVGATEETSATVEAVPAEPRAPRPTATPVPSPTVIVNPPTFEEGQIVTSNVQRVAVHADASLSAVVMDSYATGVALEVLPPSGSYTAYPVEVDGHGWVRVRATDGLVGWVMTDQVEAQ
jgi:hypothetical protein